MQPDLCEVTNVMATHTHTHIILYSFKNLHNQSFITNADSKKLISMLIHANLENGLCVSDFISKQFHCNVH